MIFFSFEFISALKLGRSSKTDEGCAQCNPHTRERCLCASIYTWLSRGFARLSEGFKNTSKILQTQKYVGSFIHFKQYSGVSIGPARKKDVMKCSVQLERDNQ